MRNVSFSWFQAFMNIKEYHTRIPDGRDGQEEPQGKDQYHGFGTHGGEIFATGLKFLYHFSHDGRTFCVFPSRPHFVPERPKTTNLMTELGSERADMRILTKHAKEA